MNYCPYENSGHILDYLLENFDRVILFSIAYHTLKFKQGMNKISTFEKGKIVSEEHLLYLKIPQNMVLIFIPLRSFVNACQIVYKTTQLFIKYGSIDVFFSVNAFTSVIGIFLEKIGLVKRTVFWVWDYYPVNHPRIIVRIMRWLYWRFDKWATYSDRVVYLNRRLAQVRVDAGLIHKGTKYPLVPIAMGKLSPIKRKDLAKIKLGFIGVLKKSQGLDMLFDSAEGLARKFKQLTFEIVGSGPDENYFRGKAANSPIKFNFYGLVSDKKFKEILYGCTIGIAPYTPEDSNVSRYGDPGKVKRYLEFNLPAIITNVFEFSKELALEKAGIVIKYGDAIGLANAITQIVTKYDYYVQNVVKLHQKFYYRKIYPTMFDLENG